MQKSGSILVVDDNRHILESLPVLLEHDFKRVILLETPEGIPEIISKENIDLVLLDMNFSPGMNDGSEGLYWLRQLKEEDPGIVVVLMTAYGELELAVQGMKAGAADFILKPWNPEKLLSNLNTLLRLKRTETKLARYHAILQSPGFSATGSDAEYQFQSPSMQRILEAVDKIAPTEANILITGAHGTGKEVIARKIHALSLRKQEVFLPVDLGAIPDTLIESELFGYSKGSFTGAVQDKPGRFEMAAGGTLFLDEVGNISLASQARLLTVLESRKVQRIGSNRAIAADIRLVCATNALLEKMIEEKSFRADLYYRINTINIHLPPLCKRQEDIPGLSHFFLERYRSKYKKPNLDFSVKAMQKLKMHPWPGNIRELKHTIEKAVIMTEGSWIRPGDLVFSQGKGQETARPFNLEQIEKETIRGAIMAHNGNLSRAATDLGVTRATLYAKMKKYAI